MTNRRDLTSDRRAPKASEHGRRILTWAPEPLEDLEPEHAPAQPHVEKAAPHPAPPPKAGAPAAAPTRRVPKRIPARRLVLPGSGQAAPAAPPPPAAAPAPAPKPAAQPAPAPAPSPEPADAEPEGEGEAKRKRGRPRGRSVRRQVHFHVDPQEEQLLMEAVETFGSQQKALIAALGALKETALLHDEIDRLRDECTRQRRLLQEAQALFKH